MVYTAADRWCDGKVVGTGKVAKLLHTVSALELPWFFTFIQLNSNSWD
jgi:hypothetical protein